MNKRDWYIEMKKKWDRRTEKTNQPAVIRGNSNPNHLEQLYKDATLYKKLMDIQNTDVFLDLACGNGIFFTYLSADAAMSIGLDISRKMLHHVDKEKGKSLNSLQGNLLDLPFKSNSIDKILLNGALHYLRREDVVVVLREIFRILNRGGCCVLTEIPTKYCIYAIKAGIKEKIFFRIARLILKGKVPPGNTRFKVSKLRKEILEAGFAILFEETLHYSFPFPFKLLEKRLSKKYIINGTKKYSFLFSGTYIFLLKKLQG